MTFDAHYCHMATAIMHPVLDQVKPSFIIFDVRAPGTLTLTAERQSAQMSDIGRQYGIVTEVSCCNV